MICDAMLFVAGSHHQKTGHKEMDMVSNHAQGECGI